MLKYRYQQIVHVFLLFCLVFLLAACTQSAPAAPSHAATPTKPAPTTLPTGTLLYQANWSQGLAAWHASPGWKIEHGQLMIDSLSEATATIPYKPAVPDYAIEVTARMAQLLKPSANHFFIVAQNAPGKDGYEAGILSLTPREANLPAPGFAQVITNNVDANAGVVQIDYVPGTNWHIYRVAVRQDEARLFIDGVAVSHSTTMENAISNGPLSLQSMGLVMNISTVRITSL